MIYNFMALALLFSSGCMIGWGIEVFYRRFKRSNTEKVWINPGFLTGPCLPLYGFGLVFLYLLARLEKYIHIDNDILRKTILFIIMACAMTIIELIAGEVFIVKKHIKLWDYSSIRFNYKGIICLRFSFYWAVLGAVYYFAIDPKILTYLDWFEKNLLFSFVIGFFYGIFVIDLSYSFNVTDKIKAFAEENEMVIRYEELKKHIRLNAASRREKYRFLLALETETGSLREQLKDYMEKQFEQAKNGKLNDFIDKKKQRIKKS